MPVQFVQIPALFSGAQGTFVEFDRSRNYDGVQLQPHRIVIIAQKLSTGTAAANQPILSLNKNYDNLYAGRGSYLAGMAEQVRKQNPLGSVFLLPIADDAGGVKATKTLTFTGPATASGTLFIYIAHTFLIRVPVIAGDTATVIATNVKNEINVVATKSNLPGTATSLAGVVTFLANHKGALGNLISIRHSVTPGQKLPKGVSLVIADGVDGTTDPDVTDAIANMAGTQFNTIIFPFTDAENMGAEELDLEARFTALVGREGHAYTASALEYADLYTFAVARNSPHFTILPATKSPSPPWMWASAVGGASSAVADPSAPRTNIELIDIAPPPEGERLDPILEMVPLVRDAGVSSYKVNSRDEVRIGKLVTMYKKDDQDLPDDSYRRHATMLVLSAVRYAFVALFSQYGDHKLAGDDEIDVKPGQKIMQPKRILTLAYDLLGKMQDDPNLGWIVNVEKNRDQIIVEIDPDDKERANLQLPIDIIQHNDKTAIKVQHLG